MKQGAGKEGGAAAFLADLAPDRGLVDGLTRPLVDLRRAALFRAQYRVPVSISWLLGPLLLGLSLFPMISVASKPGPGPEEFPVQAALWFAVLGGTYLGAVRWPGPWPWGVLAVGWPAWLFWILSLPGPQARGEGILGLAGLLIGLLHGLVAFRAWPFRMLRDPRTAWRELKMLKERMWLRTLDPDHPKLILRTMGPSHSTGFLFRVEGGWLLSWSDEMAPLRACDLVPEGDQVRILLQDRTLLFTLKAP